MPESLRDTLDNRPAGGTTWCFDVSKLSQTSLQRLGRVAPGRIVPLLAEIDQMTRINPSLETPEDMQWHAEELLRSRRPDRPGSRLQGHPAYLPMQDRFHYVDVGLVSVRREEIVGRLDDPVEGIWDMTCA